MQQCNFLRISQIVGDKKNGNVPLLPISRSHFLRLVDEGKMPKPVKLGPRVAMWRDFEIREAVAKLASNTTT